MLLFYLAFDEMCIIIIIKYLTKLQFMLYNVNIVKIALGIGL